MMTETALPQDVETLQKLVLLGQQQERSYLEQIMLLQQKIKLLTAAAFGKKSERLALEALGQQSLFSPDVVAAPSPPKATTIEAHQRKKPRRKALPDDIPRKEIIHDLAAEDKVCSCGNEMCCIGRDSVEKLEAIPEKLEVTIHTRLKYACKNCDGIENKGDVVRSAKMPPQLLPKSYATASLLAFIVVSKYVDSLPLYRLERRFARWNVKLSRKTMTDWMLKLGAKCDALVRLLLDDARGAPWIGIDETSMRVVEKKKKRGKAKTGWIWALHCRLPRPICTFTYHESRSSAFPMKALEGYHGVVVSDDWQGYNFLNKPTKGTPWADIHHAGCWTHARRYFDRVIKATSLKDLTGTITGRSLVRIKQIYALERLADSKNYSVDKRMDMRQTKTRKIMDELQADLIETSQNGTPVGALKKAINYTLSNWKMLTVCLDHHVPIDNNGAENTIRPFVVGRKNWMFACSIRGAQTNATLYTLVETAKANGWNVYNYFVHLFELLPLAKTEQDLRALLPTCPPPAVD